MIMTEMPTITRGNLKPDLQISITDDSETSSFMGLAASAYTITGEMDGVVVFSGIPTGVALSNNNFTATLTRPWTAGETDEVGRLWLSVEVEWSSGKKQTFPDSGPLRLDVARAAGDA
jgi:hypothetical protein